MYLKSLYLSFSLILVFIDSTVGENDNDFTWLKCDSKIPQDFQNLINNTKCSSEFKSFNILLVFC